MTPQEAAELYDWYAEHLPHFESKTYARQLWNAVERAMSNRNQQFDIMSQRVVDSCLNQAERDYSKHLEYR